MRVPGKCVRLCVVHRLQPVFQRPVEDIRLFKLFRLLGKQNAPVGQELQPPEGVPAAKRRVLPRVQQLERLDDELDVADAARHQFHVGGVAE